MDHIAAAQERIVTEKLRQKLNEVNSVAQSQLAVVQDHVNFTLQRTSRIASDTGPSTVAGMKVPGGKR
ncbi:hypothetical protein L1887_08430 [Cichorium endivia]|nr:hypothetical protein L1887_08430 [Cichorium endivia]